MTVRTPGSRLEWRDLQSWYEAAEHLARRRPSTAKYRLIERHMQALPVAFVAACDCKAMLENVLGLWKEGPLGFRQPARGYRQHARQTVLIVAAKNRLHQIDRIADRANMPKGDNWRAMHG